MGDYEAEVQRTLNTAKEVYSIVEDQFYTWKDNHIAVIFNKMFASESEHSTGTTAFQLSSLEPIPLPDGSLSEPCIYTWEYDEFGEIGSPGRRIPLVTVDPVQLIAHPRYQYCTAISRNLTGHMIDNKLAPFIPYPEDEKFPHDRYLSYFQGFQWTEDQRDPDDEVIQYETVRRLHMEYRFSAETIDDTLGDSHRRLRLSDESGLLWDSSQRDLPEVIWEDGNPFSSKPPLPLHFGQEFPAPNDIFSHINHGLKKFCPNLNCIMHNCQIHITHDWELYTPALIRREPRVTSDELREEPGEPCGTECFRLMDPDDMEDQDMSMHNLDFLHGVLELDPDMLPCNLAVICKLPCRQISLYRRDLVDDSELFTPVPPRRMTLKKRKKRLTGRKRKRLIISHEKDKHVSPCAHPGPCSARVGCNCFKENTLCERNCRCPPNCRRRWKGCDSSCARDPICGKKCWCRAMGRECDPELCTACDARDLHTYYPDEVRCSTRCSNVSLQRANFKTFCIQRSRYGLGAFASEPISKGEIIGDYVGELLDQSQELLLHRNILHKHSGLNYCFGIGATTIDAQWLGNPTRFLNDSKPHAFNCAADPVVVNGEHRIIIRAVKNIEEGSELTLSYGDEYWKAHGDHSG